MTSVAVSGLKTVADLRHSRPVTRLRRGTTFLNRYVLGQPVGRGRVSVIYEADDTVNSRRVAVRLLAPQFAGDPHARDRVRHPAMIMTMLRDAGVPRVYEFGDAPLGDGSTIAYWYRSS